MSEPTRLFDGAGTDDERRLIGVARADAPPPGSLARTLSVLGVAGGVLAPTVVHATALGSGSAVSAGASGTGVVATGVTLTGLAKWLAIGITGGALTVATAKVVDSAVSDSPPPAPAAPAGAKETPTRSVAGESEPHRIIPETPSAAPAVQPASPVPDEGDQLGEELALLERARRSLAQNRPDDARDALKRHREAFPSGALSEEAAVLRIEVLLAGAENGLAEQASRDFLDAHPKSPHAPRVRDLLVRAARDPKPGLRPSTP